MDGQSAVEVVRASAPPQPVYVLMTKKHRVSRSYRTEWLITNLLAEPTNTPTKDDTHGDMYMIATPNAPPNLINSNVFFMSHRYSLVFVLDMSTTMLQVSNETFAIKLDEGVKALVTLLEQLINPIDVPSLTDKFSPQLFISVLVYSGSMEPQKRVTVLLQGAHLNTDNVTDIIDIVKKGILKLENKRATTARDNRQECSNNSSTRADNCLEKMIKAGHLGVQLLPRGAIKGIIVITDGIGGFTTPSSMHSTVNQLRTANIGCWVVLCGGGSSPSLSLGSIPDTQAVGFLTEACNGSVIDPAKLLQVASNDDSSSLIRLNPCQRCIMLWSAQASSWRERRDCLVTSGFCEHQIDPFVPQRLYMQNRTTITLPLTTLIGCRAREGFLVESALIRESILEIVLTYPWQSNININYSIRTAWPVSMTTSCSLLITVSFIAPYPFVRDFQSDIRQFTGPHATSLKRFKQTLKSLTHSDTFLSHSIAFSTNAQFYTLPSSFDKGMPLFHNPNPNQSKPVPAQGHGDSNALSVMCKYWTPLASLDINIWTKWMHTEKIILVLSQDSALPPHLLHPSSSGRYSTLQCRVAALKLFTCLRSWCSLTLLENQLFLKFLPDDGSPCHFCVIRVSQMQPCVLVHVGFIEGTPHVLQIDTVTKLRSAIEKLVISLPLKESQLPSLKRKKSSRLPQQPCTTIINKQLQKMLISYDLPRESTSEVPVQLEYLDRFEWQWDVPHRNPDLLMGLLQQRLREGFLIASSSNGVATLVAQIQVQQPSSTISFPSLIQYVIFPFNPVTGKFLTEVWVEPQYQVVSDTPPGLEYLRNEKTDNISYKIHSKDISVLTQITTFLEYSPNKKDIVLSPSPVNAPLGGAGMEATPLTVKHTQDIHSDLSSLYSRSHVTTLAFSAFSEGVSSSGPLTLGDCSLLNSQLNRKFLNLLNDRLTASTVLVKEPGKLMQRLRASDELKPFFELYLETTSHPLWKCFIIDDPKGLLLIFTPCFICCSPSTSTDSMNVLSFPVVLMYTTLPHLLGEDTVLSGLQPLPTDKHFNCLFESSTDINLSSGFNPTLLGKVRHIHTLAYLSALQDGLTMAGKDLLSLPDLEKGLTVCSKAMLSIDLTPLLMGVCHHCGLANGTTVTIETLASLLETLDQQNHDYSVQLSNDHINTSGSSGAGSGSHCLQREKDINNLFREFLAEIGFISVNRMGYYWYKEDHEHSRETSVVDEEDEVEDDDDKTDTSLGTPPPSTSLGIPPPSTEPTVAADDDSDFDWSNLEPIFTPPTKSTSTRVIHINHAPLFIRLRTVLSSVTTDSDTEEKQETIEKIAEQGNMSLCSESLFSGTCVKPSTNQYWKLSLTVETFSLLEARDLAEDKRSHGDSSMLSIHSCFRPVISLLKSKTEWLVKDELVSRARELFDRKDVVPPSSLLPSVTSHIQGSFKRFNNCLMEQIPVRFVLGQSSSSPQFMQFMSSIELPDTKIRQADNNYFYFMATPPGTPGTFHYATPPRIEKGRSKARSSTPTSLLKPPSRQSLLQSHRRTRSLTSELSSISSHTHTQAVPIPSSSYYRKSMSSVESPLEGTLECPLEEVTDSMYDASKSNSVTSMVTTPNSTIEEEDKVWIVLRVVTHQVEVYLHSRRSIGLADHRRKQLDQCSSVIKAVQAICHKTNQWYLLKDLLDTHLCSPLLLAESSSAAWVEGTTNAVKELTVDGEAFASCEFECKLQWREHITPHWRLKNMGNKIALRITSSALSAFAVSNRQDVYVLQDVMDDGEEAVFYLRVSESVCVEDRNFNNETMPFDDPQRCDTRATVDDDSISNLSYQRSSFDVAETPSQLSRQVSTSLFSLDAGTRESVVLELYGITSPSDSMTTRLQRLIRSKLDDKALEMMCSMYTRNQKLELTNADVQFLQEYPEKPSEVFSIPIPEWVSYPQALFHYILQQFSILFTKPQYNTIDGPYSVLCVPPAVDKVLRESNLNTSVQHDLLSLYIRPFTKGRGMALISACLVSPEGVVLPPILDILPPTILPVVPSYDDIRNIYTIEQFPVISDQHTIALHIWERGNVGMNELRSRLVSAVQCGLVDVLMEIHFLQLPIATLTDEEINGLISPGLLRRSRYSVSNSNSENTSFVDVTLTSSKESMETAQRDIEEPVKGLVVMDTGSPDWEQREKQRRQQHCREILKRDALMGKRGVMKREYLEIFTMFLTNAHEIGLPEVSYNRWRVPTNYVVNAVLSQALSILSSSLASLSASCEMNFSIWKVEPSSSNFRFISRADFESSKESRQPCGFHSNNSFVIVGRDLNQWKEAMDPYDCTLRQEQYWPTEQHFLPLSSWKKYDDDRGMLLYDTARKHNTFIPRQRMVLAYLVDGMFHLWLYNVIEDRVKEVKARITNLESWQFKRSGLLYHILSQKMGLFHHTGSSDIAPLTQRAAKYYSHAAQGIPNLVNNVSPIPLPKSPSSRQSFELDHFYQDLEPSVMLSQSYTDPVKRHGHQFYETFSSHRETIKHLDLLLKVFNTWDSDRRSKTDQSTPISSEVISKLKQTSRLLHYCSSSVWLLSKSYVSNLPETVSEQTILEDASSWFNCIREKFLSEYVAYLQTLHFQSINERPPSRPKGQLSPQHATKFHKCLQRSWPGGIILIELSFQTQLFLVKLYSLELSRSSNLPPPIYDASGLFSQECSRIKDYIHTHSFNYDFHIRNIHSIVQGRLKVEGELDLRNLLNEFCNNYTTPPFYIRNRVCSDQFKIKVSVHSKSLYTHIIGHCSEYSLQRIDVIQASGNGCGSSIAWDNCLMIDLRSSITGGITAPELSCVLKETKDMYNVIVLAMPDVNEGEGPVATELPLKIYMLLVNKLEMYPRLTSNSPLISHSHRKPPTVMTSEGEIINTSLVGRDEGGASLGRQSELHDSVMYHRRKLGYGSLASPSFTSEMVFNPHVLNELMFRLKVHFENIVKSAQSHVRRDELWKRLLYGGLSPDIPVLSHPEFMELLMLVSYEELEQFDSVLGSLKHQTKKWYQSLIDFLQHKFSENIKIFRESLSDTMHAVIVNEYWHDMLIMVVCGSQSQGFYTVYRKSHEAGTSFEERKLTANIEAEQLHINDFVNYVCSFVWVDIMNSTPSTSPKLKR